ncbi:acyltransferase [Pseudonocardia acidicola]|uniref:Acyltransferase n=1 Tax=Pseudonocardia acidicola TaxID=2724939 RepID=A0ABX1SBK6_9PSEU|nr:acyltransferase [Pseudonocardia acidicola]NMH97932.1 acyltransferase [Pseudonocardia acidicola]
MSEETATRPGRASRARHVYAADLVRVLTFACVIAVHTVSTVNPIDSVPGGAAVMLLHFTREAFFVLTAFVLVHRYRTGGLRVAPFWRRRFLLVGVPYVVWSALYTGIALSTAPLPAGEALAVLVRNLLTGTAWFHLYFLLVSMQFYLVFPLFQRLLAATRGRHGLLVAASAALQVVIDIVLHDPTPTGWVAAVLPYAGSFVGSYQFFLVLGGVVALHHEQVDAWVRAHPAVLAVAFVVTGAAAEGWYQWSVASGVGAVFATDVFQPVMIPWCVAVVAVFYALGAAWTDRRAGGLGSRFVERASDRSFGVFLVHPVFLWALTVGGAGSVASHLPAPWSTFAVYVVAVIASLAAVELLRLTPLSLILTGKGRSRRRSQHPDSTRTGSRPAAPSTVGGEPAQGGLT